MHERSADGNELDLYVASARKKVMLGLESLGCHYHLIPSWQIKENYAWGVTLEVEHAKGTTRLNIHFPGNFPFGFPKLQLSEEPEVPIPHIDIGRYFCLASNHATCDPDDPFGVLLTQINEAVALLEQEDVTFLENEFREEASAYWTQGVTQNKLIWSLLDSDLPSRKIRCWYGSEYYLFGENDESLSRWVNTYSGGTSAKLKCSDSFFIRLDHPPLPSDFPNKIEDLYKFVSPENRSELQTLFLNEKYRPIQIALGWRECTNDCVVGCLVFDRKFDIYGRTGRNDAGFRQGKLPRKLAIARANSSFTLSRVRVDRADRQWLNLRQTSLSRSIQKSKILLFGCGSIGAFVAQQLAAAGVGTIILVDPDIMSWSNTLRHVLAGEHVGERKADALAIKLRRGFPHVEVLSFPITSNEFLHKHCQLGDDCDLVINLTGDWSSMKECDLWARSAGQTCLYGWLEPFALAGHVITVPPNGEDLSSGMTSTGSDRNPVIRFASTLPATKELGCSSYYQEYSSVDMLPTVAAVVETALNLIASLPLESRHVVTITAPRRLPAFSAFIADSWKPLLPIPQSGPIQIETKWPSP